MASKAQVAAEKAEFSGLTRGEAGAFFLLRRYKGAEAKYKSVRRYKARFIAEGLLTEAGAKPEHEHTGDHDARFTDKGHALYRKMCTDELAPVHDAFRRVDAAVAAYDRGVGLAHSLENETIDLRTRRE